MLSENRIALLRGFINEEPDEPFNYYALALEFVDTDSQAAVSILQELIENHPQYLPTYYKLAHLYWDLNQIEKAQELFQLGIGLAERQGDLKTLAELKAAFQNFQFDQD